jgi:hypothetical protein
MWQAIAAIAIPILTALFGILQGGQTSRLNRRIKEHLELAALASEHKDARTAIDSLVLQEANELLARGTARLSRKLNPSNVTLAVILAAVSGITIYLLGAWVVAWWGLTSAWIPVTVLALVGGFMLLLTGAGFTTLYAPKKSK